MCSAESTVPDLASSLAMMQIYLADLLKVNSDLLEVNKEVLRSNTELLKDKAEDKRIRDELLKRLQISEKRDNDVRKQLADIHKVIFAEPAKQDMPDKKAIMKAQMRLNMLGGLKSNPVKQ